MLEVCAAEFKADLRKFRIRAQRLFYHHCTPWRGRGGGRGAFSGIGASVKLSFRPLKPLCSCSRPYGYSVVAKNKKRWDLESEMSQLKSYSHCFLATWFSYPGSHKNVISCFSSIMDCGPSSSPFGSTAAFASRPCFPGLLPASD